MTHETEGINDIRFMLHRISLQVGISKLGRVYHVCYVNRWLLWPAD